MSNVHGLYSDNKDDEDDDKHNTRFVGGVDSRGGGSGLAVEPNNDDSNDNNNSSNNNNPSATAPGGGGGGGGDPRDSVFSQASNAETGEEVRRTITMYRNGFVVDDGPYRRLDDPANAEFLRSLAQGVTPRELLSEGDVTVGLIDKRSEDYVEQFQSFSGAGTSLGGSTTTDTTSDSIDPSTLPTQPPEVDPNQPTTAIQVRLAAGGRRVIRVNMGQTVQDLAAHLRNDASGSSFRLLAGFPPKPITDLSQTVEEAGLKGASVSMQSA